MPDAPFLALLGLVAALLALLDPIPYVHDILRRRTRPHRATWFIWSVLAIVTLCAQVADGATWSAAMLGVQAAATVLVFVLSIRWGEGGTGPADATLLLLAAGGILGWAVSSHPVVATLLVMAADAIGLALMLPKTWRDPWSETRSSYILASASGVLGAVAVGGLDPSLIVYPAYFACANGFIAVVISVGRRRTGISEALLLHAA